MGGECTSVVDGLSDAPVLYIAEGGRMILLSRVLFDYENDFEILLIYITAMNACTTTKLLYASSMSACLTCSYCHTRYIGLFVVVGF